MATANELRAQLAAAEAAEREADRANRKAQSEAWAALVAVPGNWEWRATPTKRTEFMTQVVMEGAVVEKRLKQDLLLAWKANGFPSLSSDYEQEERWFGMFYWRTDEGILTHEGGGYLILRDPKLCNDQEWMDILAGKPAEKFIK